MKEKGEEWRKRMKKGGWGRAWHFCACVFISLWSDFAALIALVAMFASTLAAALNNMGGEERERRAGRAARGTDLLSHSK